MVALSNGTLLPGAPRRKALCLQRARSSLVKMRICFYLWYLGLTYVLTHFESSLAPVMPRKQLLHLHLTIQASQAGAETT